jgi:hypothetical protein
MQPELKLVVENIAAVEGTQVGTALEHLREKTDDPVVPKRRLNNDLRFWTLKLLTEGLLVRI